MANEDPLSRKRALTDVNSWILRICIILFIKKKSPEIRMSQLPLSDMKPHLQMQRVFFFLICSIAAGLTYINITII